MNKTEMAAFRNMIEGMDLSIQLKRMALFKPIVVRTPMVRTVSDRLLKLYKNTLQQKELHELRQRAGMTSILPECGILAITGASHSGKSTSVKNFAYHVLPRLDVRKGTKPMLVVSLTEEATIRQMWFDVLREFDDPNPSGERQRAENRAQNLARLHGTQIIAIDETQNLSRRNSETALRDALKKVAQRSQFALVLIGDATHVDVMLADKHVANRCQPRIEIAKYDVGIAAEREEFSGFLAHLDKKMVEAGVFRSLSRISESPFREEIMLHSEGYIGVASRLVETAIEHYCKDEDDCLTMEAFARAALARRDNQPKPRR